MAPTSSSHTPHQPTASVLLTYRYEAIASNSTQPLTAASHPNKGRKKGFLQAKNERDARLQLRQKALIATRLSLVTQHRQQGRRDVVWNQVRTRLYHTQHVALVCHTIQDALDSGQTLVNALHTAEQIAPTEQWELAIIQLRQQLLSGQPVSPIVAQQSKLWSKPLATLLMASDQADLLVEGFHSAAQLAQRNHYWYSQWQATYWRGIGWLSLLIFTAFIWWLSPIQPTADTSSIIDTIFAGPHWVHHTTHAWLWPLLTVAAIITWLAITFPKGAAKAKRQLGHSFAITRTLWQKHQTCLWVGHWWAGLAWQHSPQEAFKLACGLAQHTETQRTLGHVLTQLEHGYPLADAIDDVPHIHPHIRLSVRLATNQQHLKERLWQAWDTVMMEQASTLKMLWIGIQWAASGLCIVLLLDMMLFHIG